MMAVGGEPGDTQQFAEFIEKNMKLYRFRNGFDMTPSAAAHYIQRNLADYLRSRTPYQVNLIICGVDITQDPPKPEVYYLDYLGTMAKVPYGIHGYSGFFATSVLDRSHRADMTVEEGVELLRKCVNEIQKRLLLNLPVFKVCIVDKNGIRDLPDMGRAAVKGGEAQEGPQTVEMIPAK